MVILLAGGVAWLTFHAEFARYALTASSWATAEGTVVSRDATSIPTVQFAAGDGAVYSFSEDYLLMCGRRRGFCLVRTFKPGETVPVVYDPAAPKRAYIHDWALFANVGGWFVLAIVCLFVPWIAFSGKSPAISIQLGRDRNPE